MFSAKHVCVCAALVLAALQIGCDGSDSKSTALLDDGVEGGVYLALGDSIAAGSGASDADSTSYAGLVGAELRERYGIELRSFAAGGHTTQDLIDEQLPPALDLLRSGEVRLVTLTIGGNDLAGLAASPVCPVDPSDPACPFGDVLSDIEGRFDSILSDLRAAGPDVPVIVQLYPNLFSGSGHLFEGPAEYAFGRLDSMIAEVAARHDMPVADPREAFEGRARDLTHVTDPTPDNHPNDAGYRLIADAFLEVVGILPSSAD